MTDKKYNFSIGSKHHAASLAQKYTAKELKATGNFKYVPRSRKHRYVLFIGDRRIKSKFKKNFKLPAL
jgi:hypothetical protein